MDPHVFTGARGLETPLKIKIRVKPIKQCANCGTTASPVWRRAKMEGQPLFCNACGVMYNCRGILRQPKK